MIIADHPGPVGQIHFEDDEPEGGRPGQFCSSTCTYTYRFDAEDAGRTVRAAFLTDYSLVDQEVFQEDPTRCSPRTSSARRSPG